MTLAAVSAVMYRLQQTGDPLVIVWGAAAIIVITVAASVARALEQFLSRFFAIDAHARPDEFDHDHDHDHDHDAPAPHRRWLVNAGRRNSLR